MLLLNSTYEPLTALPIRRAVVMLLCGKADVVHDDPGGPVIHSASRVMVVPSVIRLRTYVRVPYRARIPMTRAALMHRDRFRCAYCGSKADTVDHVVPRSRGGEHSWENCVAACLFVRLFVRSFIRLFVIFLLLVVGRVNVCACVCVLLSIATKRLFVQSNCWWFDVWTCERLYVCVVKV